MSSGRERRRRGRLGIQTQMNLTSLIDVVFILLVAFMIVAPNLDHGLQVDLAETEGRALQPSGEPISLVITMPEDEREPRFYMDGDRVTLDRLHSRLETRRDYASDPVSVLIEPDANVPTEATLQVLGIVIELGIQNYGFVTQPPRES